MAAAAVLWASQPTLFSQVFPVTDPAAVAALQGLAHVVIIIMAAAAVTPMQDLPVVYQIIMVVRAMEVLPYSR
jgi:hypothetical protein